MFEVGLEPAAVVPEPDHWLLFTSRLIAMTLLRPLAAVTEELSLYNAHGRFAIGCSCLNNSPKSFH
jgi:hypothetical protein